MVLLVLMLLGALPTWPHSRNWGYYPTGGLGLVLVILVVLLLLGKIEQEARIQTRRGSSALPGGCLRLRLPAIRGPNVCTRSTKYFCRHGGGEQKDAERD